MLSSLNDIKKGLVLNIEGQACLVLSANFVRMQQRKPVMQTKLKNLANGKVLEINFHPGDKVAEADLERKKANFLYKDAGRAYFMDNENFEQLEFTLEELGRGQSFLREGETVTILYFQGSPINVSLPAKVELRVVVAPPAVKGDTAGTATKTIELETGFKVNVPLFVNEGDVVRINTETGDYVERVS